MNLRWEYPSPANTDCVLVGCDTAASWMLSWWWAHYTKYNDLPIVFADFGMNIGDRKWCQSRGELITIPGKFRCNWFKKPAAILQCNYYRILWIDLDCEIRGSVLPIIEYANDGEGFAGVLDPYTTHCKAETINTGVIAIRHGNPLVVRWANQCIFNPGKFRGDQEVLGNMLGNAKPGITIMPRQYNTLRLGGFQNDAVIMHWTGNPGKKHIKQLINPPAVPKANSQPKLPLIRSRSGPIKSIPKILQPSQPRLIIRYPSPLPLTLLKRSGIRKFK